MEWARLRGEEECCVFREQREAQHTPATLGVEMTATGDGGQAGPSLLSET